ncbi:MAG: hypothetical protein V1748_05845 [Actinomycetota bacterium]
MRRLLVLTTIVLLGMTGIAVGGCGGQTREARQYMTTADDMYEAVDQKLIEISKQSDQLISAILTGNTSVLTQDPAELTRINDTLETAIPELDDAKAEYQKILPLKGVDDYVEYARAMIAATGGTIAAVKAGQELLAQMGPIVASGDATQLQSFISQNMATLTEVQQLNTEATKLVDTAQAIKTDKDLGE